MAARQRRFQSGNALLGDEWTDSDKDMPQSIRQEAFHQCELAKKEGEEAKDWAKSGISNFFERQ
jgi:hypothetical protein